MSSHTTEPHAKGEFGEPAARPGGPGAWHAVRKVLKPVASLRLTVVLFALGMLLIFFGTVAQLDNGVWTVVGKYFWSWVVMVPADLVRKFLAVFWEEQFPRGGSWEGSFPFPGGILIGLLMVVNLLAAHFILLGDLVAGAARQSARGVGLRKSLVAPLLKRSGIYLIHGGILLLFAGEAITREYAVEQRMTIDEGKSANYTEDHRKVELAVTDHSGPGVDHVTVIPEDMLKQKGRVSNPDLPFDVEVLDYMANSKLVRAKPGEANPADRGAGRTLKAERQPEVSGVDPNQQVDLPSAYVRLYKTGTDEGLGTYLLSLEMILRGNSDEVKIGGKTYEVSLRFKRYYKPYRVHLDEFRFDRFTGTQKAKNYSSDVRVFDEAGNLVREQHIAMNEPMRYNGETFYQGSFDPRTERTTILQVVRNPGWLLPYFACAIVSLGLVVHFLIYLVRFLTRSAPVRTTPVNAAPGAEPAAPPPAVAEPPATRFLPWLMLGLTALYLLSVAGRMAPKKEPFDYDAAARMRVVEGGRVKPLDTVARVALRLISGREEFEDESGRKQPAIRWWLDTVATGGPDQQGAAWKYQVIRIDNEQVLNELKLEKREGFRYSMEELWPKRGVIQSRVDELRKKTGAGKKLDRDETKFKELFDRIHVLLNVTDFGGPPNPETGKYEGLLLIPPAGTEDWKSLREYRDRAMEASVRAGVAEARRKLAPKLADLKTEDLDQILRKLHMDPQTLTARERESARKNVAELLQADPEGLVDQMQRVWLETALALLPEAEASEVRAHMRAEFQKRLEANPAAATWERMVAAYREGRRNDFAREVAEYDRLVNEAGVPDTVPPKNLLETVLFAPWNALGHNRVEVAFNRFAPFYRCAGLYVIAFVLALAGFTQVAAGRPAAARALRRSAFFVLLLTFAVHAVALFARMYLMERPMVFVTNLYSSAIFIGLGCVGLCLVIERIFPMGVGNALAAMLGLTTTIVAHNLVAEDTLEMMQAVLDTNFWLATHVTTVTLGYTATFVAGFLGALYILQMLAAVVRDSFLKAGEPSVGDLLAFGTAALGVVGVPLFFLWFLTSAAVKYEPLPPVLLWALFFAVTAVGLVYALALMLLRVGSPGVDAHGRPVAGHLPRVAGPVAALALTPERGKVFGQMVYGVVCFATLLSFVGTVLGGIWADQSWGRFWGWDPKENGAVLIVLWNVLILHARWAGLVKDRGVAVLAVFGNVVTAWSWFGTNQLQVGLHAYGFDSRLADGCFNFWVSQVFILALGLIPRRFWAKQPPAAARASGTSESAAEQASPPSGANGSANSHPRRGKEKRRDRRR